jgi:hypothetical protein
VGNPEPPWSWLVFGGNLPKLDQKVILEAAVMSRLNSIFSQGGANV